MADLADVTLASDKNFIYLNKCMEIFQLFNSEKKNFFFKLNIENSFNITVKHSEKGDTLDEIVTKKKPKKKYISPSTKRRNAVRHIGTINQF